MDKQPTPVKETPEELQQRRDMSESQALRDQASFEMFQDQQRREGKGGLAGF